MQCTQCGLWELAAGDLVCAWCGASYLRFSATLEPAELSLEDYPPPVALRVRNESPVGAITLERIEPGRAWISLLPDQALPQTLAPGAEQSFLMDVDTFAAGLSHLAGEAKVAVRARFAAAPATATLRLEVGPAPHAAA